MKVWKVVAVRHSKRRSAFPWKDQDLCLTYPPGEWVEPKVGRIFAFKDLESALAYAQSGGWSCPVEVWEGEEEAPYEPLWVAVAIEDDPGVIGERGQERGWRTSRVQPHLPLDAWVESVRHSPKQHTGLVQEPLPRGPRGACLCHHPKPTPETQLVSNIQEGDYQVVDELSLGEEEGFSSGGGKPCGCSAS
jgi:hypothetical protein